jgi:hypothetical protein
MPAYCLTVDPAIMHITPLMPFVMRGTVSRGVNLVPVWYPNLYYDAEHHRFVTPEQAVSIGAAALDKALSLYTVTDAVTVFGWSMGSQVICKYLRDYARPQAKLAPAVRFITVANPEFPHTGVYSAAVPPFTLPRNGGPGIPDDIQYPCIDFARQYDGMADYPNAARPTKEARDNAAIGQTTIHNDYFGVTVDDAANRRRTEGNVTYVLSPTSPLPLATRGLFGLFKSEVAAEDKRVRPKVEASYDRSFLPLSA